MKESYPVQLAEYAVQNRISLEPAFVWWAPYALKKCNPSCTSVFPFYHYFPALCSRTTLLYTSCVSGECILHLEMISVASMFNNFIKHDMTISFFVNLRRHVFSNLICSHASCESIQVFDFVHASIKDGVVIWCTNWKALCVHKSLSYFSKGGDIVTTRALYTVRIGCRVACTRLHVEIASSCSVNV